MQLTSTYIQKTLSVNGIHLKITDDMLTKFKEATIHKSYSKDSYDKLEFLGDGIIHSILTQYLYARYSNTNEGHMSKLRSKLASTETLNLLADAICIDKYAKVGLPYSKMKVLPRDIKEDMFEAFIGALSLCTTYDTCYTFICTLIDKHIDLVKMLNASINYRETLQISMQRKYNRIPQYTIIDKKINNEGVLYFNVIATIDKTEISTAWGETKKIAINNAAKYALDNLDTLNINDISPLTKQEGIKEKLNIKNALTTTFLTKKDKILSSPKYTVILVASYTSTASLMMVKLFNKIIEKSDILDTRVIFCSQDTCENNMKMYLALLHTNILAYHYNDPMKESMIIHIKQTIGKHMLNDNELTLPYAIVYDENHNIVNKDGITCMLNDCKTGWSHNKVNLINKVSQYTLKRIEHMPFIIIVDYKLSEEQAIDLCNTLNADIDILVCHEEHVVINKLIDMCKLQTDNMPLCFKVNLAYSLAYYLPNERCKTLNDKIISLTSKYNKCLYASI